MDIDYDAAAGVAYHTVQLSAKEVFATNRRQHFCNMMDLLQSSCKTSGLLATSFTDDELVEFWLGEVLPLMFDGDAKIQSCAVAAMAEALVALDVAVIHTASKWPQLRNELVQKYVPLIGEMRDAKNSNWHKIWTLLVQIMDEELLRGCTYINKFLAVVELGFRNPDNGVRSESFLCWRVLIKIFAAYNELASAKRLRLLLIPLRTSQSRSSHVSGIKLRVWWYLLTCLDQELSKSFDTAVEYFLSFILGGGPRALPTGLAHNYQTARELALPCLVALWNVDSSEPLQRLLRDLRLESLEQPSPLMREEVMREHWRPLLAAAVAGMKLLTEHESTETEQLLLQLLLRNLTLALFKLGLAPLTKACCAELQLTGSGRVLRAVFNTIAGENLALSRGSDNNGEFVDVLEAFMKLCLKSQKEVPPAILQRSISLIFASEPKEFQLISSFAERLMKMTDEEEEDYETFALKLVIWRQVSAGLSAYLKEHPLDYRVSHNASLLDSWLLWPLQMCSSFAGRRSLSVFDSSFCEQWRQLINAGHNSPERQKFLQNLKSALNQLMLSSKEELHFAEFFDAYVGAVLKLGICKEAPHYKDVFGLMQTVFEHTNQQLLEACLNTLRNAILDLRQNELMVIFDALKPTLAAALQCWSKLKCEGSFLDEWKRAIQEKFRKLPLKSMANQVKDLFKTSDELYVIIPSVWSLQPDKLTERQKERLAEKSDIPALYNDMTQSQDSASLKPWTPKKVVISKSKQGELALNGKDDEVEEEEVVVIEDTESDKYNFRKPRSLTEQESASTKPTTEEMPRRQTRQRAAQKDPEATPERVLRSPKKPATPSPSPTPSAGNTKNPIVKLPPIPKQLLKPTPMQSEDLFPEAAAATDVIHTQPQVSINEPNKKLPETQTSTEVAVAEMVPSTQLLPEICLEPAAPPAPTVPVPPQETSPRKPNTRLCNLNSPPDRKQTSNLTSPTLRPKPTGHLTGRGAQLINMIRNKKLDPTLSTSHTAARIQITPARIIDRSEQIATPTSELNELLPGNEHTSTPIQAKDLLIFSKRLPSPSASPSASILKRKLRSDSIDDFSMDSPALKRKRVSFHDPPVSVTKEYLRDTEETRSSKPKRCLLLDKIAQTSEAKQALKRRGRLDSIIEIEKFASEQTARTATTDKSMDKSAPEMGEDEAFTTLKWNDTLNPTTTGSGEDPKHSAVAEGVESAASCQDLAIMDTDTALDLVVEQCSLETLLERYFKKSPAPPLKSAHVLAKFLSNQMTSNDKLKTNVLETLSENHSKDFLDHAVRENLSSVVCDRLNPNSVLDYICAKSKINNNCRSNLLTQVLEILKSSSRASETERFEFVQQLLLQGSLNDEQLLDLIGQLMRARDSARCKKDTTACLVGPDNVAETAADSSSNL